MNLCSPDLVTQRLPIKRCAVPVCIDYPSDTKGDTNGDGIFSIAESGDFKTVGCGCSSSSDFIDVTTPAPVAVRTQSPVLPGPSPPVSS